MHYQNTVLALSAFWACSALHAQVTAERLLDKMQDVSVYPIVMLTPSNRTYARSVGQGIEFSFLIADIQRPMTDVERVVHCFREQRRHKRVCNPANTADTSRKLVRVQRLPGAVLLDSVFDVTIEERVVTVAQFELGVASQVTDLHNRDGWLLSGKVQEFPVLSLYTTFRPDWFVSPYLGVQYTLGELKNVRIAQQDSIATVTASAAGGGASFGIAVGISKLTLYLETGYSYLRFNTEHWKLPATLQSQPASFPRSLELSGLRLVGGAQLNLGHGK